MSLPTQQAQQEQERQGQLLGVKSVVLHNQLHEERWGRWHKLADDYGFARLHTKFWRKGMLDQEEEWCGKQGSDSNASMHGSDDPDREVNPMDVGGDDDVGPGCYFLDIGLEELRLKNIWIRSEYLRMYDYCIERCNGAVGMNQAAPSIAIIGQPGIGTPSFRFVDLRHT